MATVCTDESGDDARGYLTTNDEAPISIVMQVASNV